MSNKYKSLTIIVVGLFLIIFLFKGHFIHEHFDSEKWKTSNLGEEENWSLRWDMMNSLRDSYELEEMTKFQILDLLGDPDSESKNEFIYYLGYSKKGINTGRLRIKFENDKVVAFSVWQG